MTAQLATRSIPARLVLRAAAGLALGYILLPLVLISWLAFFRNPVVSFPPEGYTLRWFRAILDQRNFVDGFVMSLQVGVFAMLAGWRSACRRASPSRATRSRVPRGGPRFQMMGPVVYGQFAGLNNWPFGAALAFVLMTATLALTVASNVLVQRRYRR